MMELSRRNLISFGGAAALAASTPAWAAKEGFFMRTKLPIGLQLYTLGPGLAADLDNMLSQVAKTGYRTVELAGYLGKTPKDLRAAFDKAGLAATSAHVQGRKGGPDPSLVELDRLIPDAHVLGVKTIVLPMFPIPTHIDMAPKAGDDRKTLMARLSQQMTLDDWKATADLLNTAGATLTKAGLGLGYHNHNVEFAPSGGTTGMDYLLRNTDPALVHFEMDVGWVVAAGADPFDLIEAHPHRFRQMHVKDVLATTRPNFIFQQDPTEIGSGMINWKKLLPTAHAAGIRDFFVEQEAPFARPRLEAIKVSFDYLNGLMA